MASRGGLDCERLGNVKKEAGSVAYISQVPPLGVGMSIYVWYIG